jgi:hypothetical protein
MNDGRRFMFGGFTFSPGSAAPLVKTTASWAWLELTEGWRTWFVPNRAATLPKAGSAGEMAVTAPASVSPAPAAEVRHS